MASTIETQLHTQTDKAVALLVELLRGPNEALKKDIFDQINQFNTSGPVDPSISDERLFRILRNYDQIDEIFRAWAFSAIPTAYMQGAAQATHILRRFNLARIPDAVDLKAVNILLRDMTRDFSRAVQGGRSMTQSYFVFSKQGVITESLISGEVVEGLILNSNAEAAKANLVRRFSSIDLPVHDVEQLLAAKARERAKLLGELFEKAGPAGAQEFREAIIETVENRLEQEKFLQLINKNGDVMTFKVDTYSEIVARTRIADAQTQGTVDEAEAFDVFTFRVSSHNTLSAICKPHEGKIYTTRKEWLSDPRVSGMLIQNVTAPSYHPNCLHRINAVYLVQRGRASA